MRNLALLVRKDFVSATMSYGNVWLVVAIWLIVMAATPTSAPLMFTIMVYLMVLVLFQTEENDLVCNVIGILPIHKRDAVIARYLYLYALLAIQTLVICILCPTVALLRGVDTGWRLPLLIALTTSLLMCAIVMPLNYKFGVVKMRIVTVVVYAVMVMVASGVSPLLTAYLQSAPQITLPMGELLSIACAGALLLSLLSMAVSVRIKR